MRERGGDKKRRRTRGKEGMEEAGEEDEEEEEGEEEEKEEEEEEEEDDDDDDDDDDVDDHRRGGGSFECRHLAARTDHTRRRVVLNLRIDSPGIAASQEGFAEFVYFAEDSDEGLYSFDRRYLSIAISNLLRASRAEGVS
jgi:hypothetical protein